MFDKNVIRKDVPFKVMFRSLLNKPKGGGAYFDIAEDLVMYARERRRRVEGFYLAQFVDDNKNVYARSSVYKVAALLKQLGMLEYSGTVGLWRISNEFGNAGKRMYRWWREFVQGEALSEEELDVGDG
ncbi:hypothetical protein COT72_03040 [archaeon CG10_big_fil_rev_8_21_14_0_10_43_11]|nr:MAG: hypothetical protein COT72_03040 [archaeon CG10_big_fil_rev_8_21_14_0_10_43_11]